MIEEWRDVPGYEGMYEVSDWGRVRRNGRILKLRKDGQGYLFVSLYKNGTKKEAYIHRLVSLAFIPNPNNYPEVNHKDENKTNNAVENLEWCTRKYNANYSLAKPILQYDLLGNFIREWPSATKVEEELGIYYSSVSKCCSGRYNSAGGFVWRFKE